MQRLLYCEASPVLNSLNLRLLKNTQQIVIMHVYISYYVARYLILMRPPLMSFH